MIGALDGFYRFQQVLVIVSHDRRFSHVLSPRTWGIHRLCIATCIEGK